MSARTAKNASLYDVCKHLVSGALLGVFLALSTIVGNAAVYGAISNSSQPRLLFLILICCAASLTGVGSAISGFILISLDKSR